MPSRIPAILLGVALTAPACAQTADGMMARIERPQAERAGDLDELGLNELMARLQVPGLSVAVVKDFKLHWAKAYGVADAATGRLLDTETMFQSASIAKPATAFAAMRLVQERRLDLDADVNRVLTSWRAPVQLTPRALFSHTSGAADGWGFDGYAPGAPLPTIVQILDGQPPSNAGHKLTFARAPFIAYQYSGGGVLVMQQAMMDLTGQPFAPFMQAAMLAPLQMSHSTFELLPMGSSKAAFGHDRNGSRTDAAWRVHPELATSNLWTTPTDLAKFIIEMQSALRGPRGKILEQGPANEMVKPVGVGSFAVGWMVQDGYFMHRGSNWGYRAWLRGHLRDGHGIVIMTNGENGMALMNQVAERITRAYGWN